MDRDSLRQATQRSMDYARRLPQERLLPFGDRQVPVRTLLQTLETFQQLLDTAPTAAAFNRALHEQFEVVQSPGRNTRGEVLFTGYYEIILDGSLVASPQFPYPLYKRPPDLLDAGSVPATSRHGQASLSSSALPRTETAAYYTRREIDEAGKLRGRGLELFWLRNPVDGYFLHVQGSGQIRLPNGQIRRVNYAGSNGHPYASIGRILIAEGRVPREGMSLQSLRRYFREAPQEMTRVLYQNPRYIFFRQVDQGPQGNLGFLLVPGRSVATDQSVFPPAGLAFVHMQQPVLNAQGDIVSWQPTSRFVFSHDTGSAITGPGRIDLFWGSGPQAEIAAGHMQHTGSLFFLLKRQPRLS
ncbi:MAG: murein transglycosylase A [Candidatus Tectimicrobiota bacterium]